MAAQCVASNAYYYYYYIYILALVMPTVPPRPVRTDRHGRTNFWKTPNSLKSALTVAVLALL